MGDDQYCRTATYADDADSYAYIRVKNNGSEAAELSLSSFRINTIRKTEITSARSSTSMYEDGYLPDQQHVRW
ncbi:MAG: hypothetical protein ACLVJ6_10320 [Merdibacter sp.]